MLCCLQEDFKSWSLKGGLGCNGILHQILHNGAWDRQDPVGWIHVKQCGRARGVLPAMQVYFKTRIGQATVRARWLWSAIVFRNHSGIGVGHNIILALETDFGA